MSRPKGEPPNLEARIITAIGKAGPRNVAQLSRMTGAHQETIRYKIKKRFSRLGFGFHAQVDFDKLGLNLHWATLDFPRTRNGTAPRLLAKLNRMGYLTHFAKLVPQGNYVALFALPRGVADAYPEFLAQLRDKGILRSFSLDRVLVSRHKVMDPHHFNFRSGQWQIDWGMLEKQQPIPLPPGGGSRVEDFDYYDLLVIKELQNDSLQHLTGMAKKLKVHQKTLEYHYRTHIKKLRLVPSYGIRWTQAATKRSTNSTITTRLVFHGLNKSEFDAVQGAISKIPFLWMEDLLQNGDYVATLYTPAREVLNVVSYVSAAAPDLGSKVDLGFIKPDEAASFTIPYNMYQSGAWKFNPRQIESALR